MKRGLRQDLTPHTEQRYLPIYVCINLICMSL